LLSRTPGNRGYDLAQQKNIQPEPGGPDPPHCIDTVGNSLVSGRVSKIVYSLVVSQHFFQSMQPDLCATGGFSEMMKIFAMASAANIPLIPHVWGTNVGLAAALQLFAGLPHFPERRFPAEPFFEFDRLPHPFREEVTLVKFVMQIGYLDIPQRPGLG